MLMALVLVAVTAIAFSIGWIFIGKPKSRADFVIGLFLAGLIGIIVFTVLGDGINSAIARGIEAGIGWMVAYVITTYVVPKLRGQTKEKRKEKPKRDQTIEFDGQVFPIVEDEVLQKKKR